jgi:hypothetical protein
MSNINWDDAEALEVLANQSICNGRDVGRARAALKAIHGYDKVYDDEKDWRAPVSYESGSGRDAEKEKGVSI